MTSNQRIRSAQLVSLSGIAAALFCIAPQANAQSSVTVYGIVDQVVSRYDGQSNLTFWPNTLVGRPGTVTLRSTGSSRLGFRGSEDLGGGLKANFLLEHRFAPDTGELEAGAVGFWQGMSWVGVSGPFGEVRMGRQLVPAFYVGLASDPWGYEFNSAGAAGFTRAGNPVTRASNSVGYKTPTIAGFSSEIQVAAGEGSGAVPGQPGNGRNAGINLLYSGGPLWAGVGFNDLQQNTSSFAHRYWNAGIAYDFGPVRLNGLYSEGKSGTSDNKLRSAVIGATAPIGAGRLKAVVARLDAAVGVNANASNTSLPANTGGFDTLKFGLGYEYFLSKRTSVRLDFGTAKTQTFSRTKGVEAGIKHFF